MVYATVSGAHYEPNPVTGSGSTQYYVWRSSDNRLVTRSGTSLASHKENIQEFNDSLNLINQMQPKTFVFKDFWVDQEDPESIYNLQTQTNYGLIVDDIIPINPELLYHKQNKDTGEWEPYMWKSEAIIALLVGSVNQLTEEVNSLKERIAILEG